MTRAQPKSTRTSLQVAEEQLAIVLKYIEENPGQVINEIAHALHLSHSRVQRYCSQLRGEEVVRKVRHIRGDGIVSYLTAWAPGCGDEEPLRSARENPDRARNAPNANGEVRRVFVPAVQIGMHRDPMVAALFGPIAMVFDSPPCAHFAGRPAAGRHA